MNTIADAGEHDLIARVRARAGSPPSFVPIGIGDDAAVVEPARGMLDVITTDALVEHVHFRRDWTDARSIGTKAVTVNLSDLAAMGATPRVILLSLILPPAMALSDFDALIDGAVSASTAAGASVVGGNISRSPGPLVVDVTAMVSVGRRRVMTRGGGRAGDELYVTGTVGGAAAGLAILQSGVDRASLSEAEAASVARYERPEARLRCGRVIAGSRSASACMDLSDGLADAARQIAEASGTGVTLDAESIPLGVRPSSDPVQTLLRPSSDLGHLGHARVSPGPDPVLDAALTGGEDYELLFAVRPRRRRAFLGAMAKCRPLQATLVGRLTKDPAVVLARGTEQTTLNSGFRHF